MMRYERVSVKPTYEGSVDECLAVFRKPVDGGSFEVSVRRYAKGKLKLQMSRLKTINGEERYIPLGRLIEGEISVMVGLLREGERKMQEVRNGDAVGCEAEPCEETAS